MVTRDVLKVPAQIALAYGSCNFENFQNITRAHKSRNALAFIRFPILIVIIIIIIIIVIRRKGYNTPEVNPEILPLHVQCTPSSPE